jgi:hypothetical protein
MEVSNEKTGMDNHARKLELINKKVAEINDRRRGMKITSIEDELDRQELRNYMRILGMDPGNVRLESLSGVAPVRDRVFYATLFVEMLIEVAVIYFFAATMLTPDITTLDIASCALLLVIFAIMGYRIYKDTRVK